MEEEHYTPAQTARIMARSGRPVSERRIRQMLQAGELEGEQSETGRWSIPRRVVHAMLEQYPRSATGIGYVSTQKKSSGETLHSGHPKKEESPTESSDSVRELLQRVEALSYELGASQSRLELTEQAESTAREERDRLRAELEAERAERRRLAERLQSLQVPESPAEASTPAEEPQISDAQPPSHASGETPPIFAMWKRIIFGRGNRR